MNSVLPDGPMPDVGKTSEKQAEAMPRTLVPTIFALWREAGSEHWVETQGTSMLPLIRAGDRILVSHKLANVRQGSIVLFRQNDQIIAHRVIRMLPDARLLTKGDHAWAFDPPIRRDALIGHVQVIERGARRITLARAKWQWIGWLIACTTLVVAVPYAWLRRIKQWLWQDKPLMTLRFVHRCCQNVLATALKPLVHAEPHRTDRQPSEPIDHIHS